VQVLTLLHFVQVLDSFGSNIYSSAHAQSASPEEYNVAINATNLTSAIEVRLYAYGTPAGTFQCQ
jgi:hypothetical protein